MISAFPSLQPGPAGETEWFYAVRNRSTRDLMGSITRQPEWVVPSNRIAPIVRQPVCVIPLASRLVSGDWWAAAGIISFLSQPLPPSLRRPAHLAPGAEGSLAHGRHRRIHPAFEGDGSL
jgi:hypothetical protein